MEEKEETVVKENIYLASHSIYKNHKEIERPGLQRKNPYSSSSSSPFWESCSVSTIDIPAKTYMLTSNLHFPPVAFVVIPTFKVLKCAN